jgi:hypothetical protein
VVLTLKVVLRRSWAAWFAELRPEPPSVIFSGWAFAAATKSLKLLIGLASLTTSASGV